MRYEKDGKEHEIGQRDDQHYHTGRFDCDAADEVVARVRIIITSKCFSHPSSTGHKRKDYLSYSQLPPYEFRSERDFIHFELSCPVRHALSITRTWRIGMYPSQAQQRHRHPATPPSSQMFIPTDITAATDINFSLTHKSPEPF